MKAKMRQADLFHGKNQTSIAEEPQPPSADIARQRLASILNEARSASKLPWPQPRVRTVELLFANMSKWLPEPEREQMKKAFSQELSRLLATD
jgi:hypothetical protein